MEDKLIISQIGVRDTRFPIEYGTLTLSSSQLPYLSLLVQAQLASITVSVSIRRMSQ